MNAVVSIIPADAGMDEVLCRLALDAIEVIPGFNTRTYFDPVSLQELAVSIKEQGVVQPIVVRPQPDNEARYFIVAGERRWRASKIAGASHIPAVVRRLTDAQALIINAIENKDREGISPAEEAQLARRMVDVCGGNHDEAARVLKWSRHALDARLLLLDATPEVLTALAARQILLGHAELLCTLPPETQIGTLARIVENKVSVDDLKTRIGSYVLDLSAAVFNTGGCQKCPRNSSTQASLFDVHVGEGRCADHACFEGKRQTRVAEMLAEQRRNYPAIFTDKEKDPASYTFILKSGPQGVGVEQYKACLGCADYGAVMSTRPGTEGNISTDACFNLACHRQKVKEYQSSLKTEVTASETNAESAPKDTPDVSSKTGKRGKSKGSVASSPKQVLEHTHRFWRDTAAAAIRENPRMGLVFAAFELLRSVESFDVALAKKYKLPTGSGSIEKRAQAIEILSSLPEPELRELLAEAAAFYIAKKADSYNYSNDKNVPNIVKTACTTLAVCKTDLARHFRVDEAFLSAHTKSGMESVLCEAEFDKWYNEREKSDKAFRKLMLDKHGNIVKTVLKSKFDFQGFVPSVAHLG